MRVPPTVDQLRTLEAARDAHRMWLAKRSLTEPCWALSEDAYTGLLLSAMLDPDARRAVVRALFSGGDQAAPPYPKAHVTAARWPTRGVDLVVRHGARSPITTLIEHKRFDSPSDAPGYKAVDRRLALADRRRL